MRLFADILKGLPENAVLRHKVADAEKRYAALETENAILKDDIRDAKTEIKKLKKQIEELTHNDLTEPQLKALKLAATDQVVDADCFSSSMGVSPERAAYYLSKLVERDMLEFRGFGGEGIYTIKPKGLEVLMSHGLI